MSIIFFAMNLQNFNFSTQVMKERKCKMNKVRKVIVVTLTYFFGLIAIISGAMVDSESIVPLIVFMVSMAWVTLFACANNNK